jgi:DDE superfamily endonuclease
MAAALCYGSRGGGAAVAFHHHPDAYDTDSLIGALGELRGFLGGQKATLLWDGLPAHRSKAMGAWLRRQRHWLVVEPLPGYAPELNPVEALWSNLKGVELANLAGDTLQGGHRGGRTWRPTGPGHPPPGLLVPAPLRPEPMVSSDFVTGRGEVL